MNLTLDQTKELANAVLADPLLARKVLNRNLEAIDKDEPEFYSALIKFSSELPLNSDQWFILLSVFPYRILRHDLKIMSKLSENQQEKLPPARF